MPIPIQCDDFKGKTLIMSKIIKGFGIIFFRQF